MPGPLVKRAAAAAPKRQVVKMHVKFTLNTADGLRRVLFELEKDSTQDGPVQWMIHFQLFERVRKSDSFTDPVVDLEVDVEANLNNKAENMASDGMTPNQAAFAIGPVADIAKDCKANGSPIDDAKASVQKTLKK